MRENNQAHLNACQILFDSPAFPLSEDRLHVVSVLGAGLLIGTALAVIIPEGVNALYADSHPHSHHNGHQPHSLSHSHER